LATETGSSAFTARKCKSTLTTMLVAVFSNQYSTDAMQVTVANTVESAQVYAGVAEHMA